MPFPWKKVRNSRISRLVNLSHKRRDAEIQPPEMEITAAATSKRKSRKAKIKSKMRKIVPKKLRSVKKDHDFGIACDEAVIDASGSVSSSASENGEGEGEGEGEDGGGSVCSDRDVIEESDGNGGCSEIVAEPVAARRSNMALCLVALAGLVGGRPFALVLTLFCLLVFKLPMMVKNKV